MTIDKAIERERLSDELRAIQYANTAQLPEESYEQNLQRRAAMRVRMDEILSKLCDF